MSMANEAQSFPKAVKAVFPSYYEKEKGEALKGTNNQPIKHLDGIMEVFFSFLFFFLFPVGQSNITD
jgi:hypothetical protein